MSMIFDQSRCPGMQLAQYQGMGCLATNFKMCLNLDVHPNEGNGCDKCVSPPGGTSWKFVCNRGGSGATPTGGSGATPTGVCKWPDVHTCQARLGKWSWI